MQRHHFFALFSGFVFGFGLLLSGMANPAKVLGFLDLAGAWDPSLAMVMAGAITVGFIAFTFATRRPRSFLGEITRLPTSRTVDTRLVVGSLGFGIGWGLAGFCPGPALVALGAGAPKAAIFTLAMLAGMAIFECIERRTARANRNTA